MLEARKDGTRQQRAFNGCVSHCDSCALRDTLVCHGICENEEFLAALDLKSTIAAQYTPTRRRTSQRARKAIQRARQSKRAMARSLKRVGV